MYTVY